jgi:hypothetical protein
LSGKYDDWVITGVASIPGTVPQDGGGNFATDTGRDLVSGLNNTVRGFIGNVEASKMGEDIHKRRKELGLIDRPFVAPYNEDVGNAVDDWVQSGYSPERKAADQRSEEQQNSGNGELGDFIGTVTGAITNPRHLAGTVFQSVPGMAISMLPAAKVAKGLSVLGAGDRLVRGASRVASGAGEGFLSRGDVANDIAQDNYEKGRDISERVAPAANAAGLAVGAIGVLGGGLESAVARRIAGVGAKDAIKNTVAGGAKGAAKNAFGEGAEELAQAVPETTLTNWGQHKENLYEGLGKNAGESFTAGVAMGAGMHAIAPHGSTRSLLGTGNIAPESVPESKPSAPAEGEQAQPAQAIPYAAGPSVEGLNPGNLRVHLPEQAPVTNGNTPEGETGLYGASLSEGAGRYAPTAPLQTAPSAVPAQAPQEPVALEAAAQQTPEGDYAAPVTDSKGQQWVPYGPVNMSTGYEQWTPGKQGRATAVQAEAAPQAAGTPAAGVVEPVAAEEPIPPKPVQPKPAQPKKVKMTAAQRAAQREAKRQEDIRRVKAREPFTEASEATVMTLFPSKEGKSPKSDYVAKANRIAKMPGGSDMLYTLRDANEETGAHMGIKPILDIAESTLTEAKGDKAKAAARLRVISEEASKKAKGRQGSPAAMRSDMTALAADLIEGKVRLDDKAGMMQFRDNRVMHHTKVAAEIEHKQAVEKAEKKAKQNAEREAKKKAKDEKDAAEKKIKVQKNAAKKADTQKAAEDRAKKREAEKAEKAAKKIEEAREHKRIDEENNDTSKTFRPNYGKEVPRDKVNYKSVSADAKEANDRTAQIADERNAWVKRTRDYVINVWYKEHGYWPTQEEYTTEIFPALIKEGMVELPGMLLGRVWTQARFKDITRGSLANPKTDKAKAVAEAKEARKKSVEAAKAKLKKYWDELRAEGKTEYDMPHYYDAKTFVDKEIELGNLPRGTSVTALAGAYVGSRSDAGKRHGLRDSKGIHSPLLGLYASKKAKVSAKEKVDAAIADVKNGKPVEEALDGITEGGRSVRAIVGLINNLDLFAGSGITPEAVISYTASRMAALRSAPEKSGMAATQDDMNMYYAALTRQISKPSKAFTDEDLAKIKDAAAKASANLIDNFEKKSEAVKEKAKAEEVKEEQEEETSAEENDRTVSEAPKESDEDVRDAKGTYSKGEEQSDGSVVEDIGGHVDSLDGGVSAAKSALKRIMSKLAGLPAEDVLEEDGEDLTESGKEALRERIENDPKYTEDADAFAEEIRANGIKGGPEAVMQLFADVNYLMSKVYGSDAEAATDPLLKALTELATKQAKKTAVMAKPKAKKKKKAAPTAANVDLTDEDIADIATEAKANEDVSLESIITMVTGELPEMDDAFPALRRGGDVVESVKDLLRKAVESGRYARALPGIVPQIDGLEFKDANEAFMTRIAWRDYMSDLLGGEEAMKNDPIYRALSRRIFQLGGGDMLYGEHEEDYADEPQVLHSGPVGPRSSSGKANPRTRKLEEEFENAGWEPHKLVATAEEFIPKVVADIKPVIGALRRSFARIILFFDDGKRVHYLVGRGVDMKDLKQAGRPGDLLGFSYAARTALTSVFGAFRKFGIDLPETGVFIEASVSSTGEGDFSYESFKNHSCGITSGSRETSRETYPAIVLDKRGKARVVEKPRFHIGVHLVAEGRDIDKANPDRKIGKACAKTYNARIVGHEFFHAIDALRPTEDGHRRSRSFLFMLNMFDGFKEINRVLLPVLGKRKYILEEIEKAGESGTVSFSVQTIDGETKTVTLSKKEAYDLAGCFEYINSVIGEAQDAKSLYETYTLIKYHTDDFKDPRVKADPTARKLRMNFLSKKSVTGMELYADLLSLYITTPAFSKLTAAAAPRVDEEINEELAALKQRPSSVEGESNDLYVGDTVAGGTRFFGDPKAVSDRDGNQGEQAVHTNGGAGRVGKEASDADGAGGNGRGVPLRGGEEARPGNGLPNGTEGAAETPRGNDAESVEARGSHNGGRNNGKVPETISPRGGENPEGRGSGDSEVPAGEESREASAERGKAASSEGAVLHEVEPVSGSSDGRGSEEKDSVLRLPEAGHSVGSSGGGSVPPHDGRVAEEVMHRFEDNKVYGEARRIFFNAFGHLKTDVALGLMFTRSLVNLAAKMVPDVPAFREWHTLAEQRVSYSNKWQEQAASIKVAFDRLPKNQQDKVNEFLEQCTLAGVWPYAQEGIFANYKVWQKYLRGLSEGDAALQHRLQTQFENMPSRMQGVVEAVFDHGVYARETRRDLIKQGIRDAYAKRIENAPTKEDKGKAEAERDRMIRRVDSLIKKLSGPYVPLKRMGKYVVEMKSKELTDAMDKARSLYEEASKRAGGSPTEEDLKEYHDQMAKVEEMKASANHYIVKFVGGQGDAMQAKERLAKLYPTAHVDYFTRQQFVRSSVPQWQQFEKIQQMASESLNPEAAGESEMTPAMKVALESINEASMSMFVESLSSENARKSDLRRTQVKGFHHNMMENFMENARSEAILFGNLAFGTKMRKSLTDIAVQTRKSSNRAAASDFQNEILKRVAAAYSQKGDTQLVNTLLRGNAAFMLMTNAAYYVQNLLQPIMMSAPYIAGRHGYGEVMTKLLGYTKTVMGALKDGNSTFDEIAEAMKMTKDQKEAVRRALELGHIDIGMNSDFGHITHGDRGKVRDAAVKVSDKLTGLSRKVEIVNRIATFLTAYDLEKAKSGKEAAWAYADQVVYATHGDYGALNSPRLFVANGFARVATQFRKFQLIQMGLMVGLACRAFKGASPAEKAIARRQLTFMMGTHFAMAGLKGTPFVSTALAALAMLGGGGDGDDEDDMIRKAVNDKAFSDFLLNGIPKLLGVDMSEKVGATTMFSLFPFVETTPSKDGQNFAKDLALAAVGPTGSTAAKLCQAMAYLGDGNYLRAAENALPKGFSNVIRAYRFSTEGITTTAGVRHVQAEDFSAFDAAMQALGLPTNVVTDRNRMLGSRYRHDAFFKDMQSDLSRRFREAKLARDYRAIAEVRKEWVEMNKRRRAQGYPAVPFSNNYKNFKRQMSDERKARRLGSSVGSGRNEEFLKNLSSR